MSVFINCPFDEDYRTLFEALVFTVHDCGFIARCAREEEDSGRVRIEKLGAIISECGLGIHELSRTELDASNLLPRFNMPLELGLFLGARYFGDVIQQQKKCLILDREPYRYQKFCSDIAGQDIKAHGSDLQRAISATRDWLRSLRPGVQIPGGKMVGRRYAAFRTELPAMCAAAKIELEELTFLDYTVLVVEWLRIHALK